MPLMQPLHGRRVVAGDEITSGRCWSLGRCGKELRRPAEEKSPDLPAPMRDNNFGRRTSN
jgi:hypothetical protein